MRTFLCILLTVSMLFAGLEASADLVIDGMPHGDETSHQAEFGHSLDEHDGGQSDTELDGEHCGHCCHGHCASMLGILSSPTILPRSAGLRASRSADVLNFAQAPPTPPPNA